MASRLLVSAARFKRPVTSSLVALRSASTTSEQSPSKPPFPGVFALLKEKTGETGKLVLGVGLAATLFSKELLIVHAETIVAASIFGVIYWLVKKLGKPTADYLDNRAQNILETLNTSKNASIAQLENDISTEEKVEAVLSCRNEIFDILRDEAEMTREEEYRRRLQSVQVEVKRRLEYQLQLEQLQKQFEQRHLVSWLEDSVRQALLSKEDESIPQCVTSLKQMTAAS